MFRSWTRMQRHSQLVGFVIISLQTLKTTQLYFTSMRKLLQLIVNLTAADTPTKRVCTSFIATECRTWFYFLDNAQLK